MNNSFLRDYEILESKKINSSFIILGKSYKNNKIYNITVTKKIIPTEILKNNRFIIEYQTNEKFTYFITSFYEFNLKKLLKLYPDFFTEENIKTIIYLLLKNKFYDKNFTVTSENIYFKNGNIFVIYKPDLLYDIDCASCMVSNNLGSLILEMLIKNNLIFKNIRMLDNLLKGTLNFDEMELENKTFIKLIKKCYEINLKEDTMEKNKIINEIIEEFEGDVCIDQFKNSFENLNLTSDYPFSDFYYEDFKSITCFHCRNRNLNEANRNIVNDNLQPNTVKDEELNQRLLEIKITTDKNREMISTIKQLELDATNQNLDQIEVEIKEDSKPELFSHDLEANKENLVKFSKISNIANDNIVIKKTVFNNTGNKIDFKNEYQKGRFIVKENVNFVHENIKKLKSINLLQKKIINYLKMDKEKFKQEIMKLEKEIEDIEKNEHKKDFRRGTV